ncbi:UDP-glucose 6-dehydrogenase family protein [Actinidia rufa]|uniref:UDP-glucose 6-dehydrogenase family protein n=1 Tax=Actinidia rufa TaxID=165716 RepID=A0A7J0ESH6_9ERIC|nr:UDP-glucose 6-dehydrogenase family protein [Actinidia rufa]
MPILLPLTAYNPFQPFSYSICNGRHVLKQLIQRFPNGVNNKADTPKLLHIDNIPTIKYECRLLHVIVNPLVILRLELVPTQSECKWHEHPWLPHAYLDFVSQQPLQTSMSGVSLISLVSYLKANPSNFLSQNGVEHGGNHPVHEADLLIVIYLDDLPVMGDLTKAIALTTMDQVQDSADIALTEEILCAKKALAASLESSTSMQKEMVPPALLHYFIEPWLVNGQVVTIPSSNSWNRNVNDGSNHSHGRAPNITSSEPANLHHF